MFKKFTLACITILFLTQAKSQSTYNYNNYEAPISSTSIVDSMFITGAKRDTIINFNTNGANVTWNFSSLVGNRQRTLYHRAPAKNEISCLFHYSFCSWIGTASNVNLAATDKQVYAFGSAQANNVNEYFLKNTSSTAGATNYYMERATSLDITASGVSLPTTTITYDNPDTLYKFPMTYNSTSRSHGIYTTSYLTLYYRTLEINRRDTTKGWGTLITPYGTFTNALKYVSNVVEIDTATANGTVLFSHDTTRYRELKWFDPSKKYWILYVRQEKVGPDSFVTSKIEYMDIKQVFPPTADFIYLPLNPNVGDTVQFQNMSVSSTTYSWNFNDPTSGTNNTSTATNPTHIFSTPGTYHVMLIAYNGAMTDTLYQDIIVNPKNVTYTFTGDGNWDDGANWLNTTIPPNPLTTTNSILINNATGGKCICNVNQVLLPGSAITVKTGSNLVVTKNLTVK